MRRPILALAAIAAVLGPAPAAGARVIDVPRQLRPVLVELRGSARVPVLLPQRVDLGAGRVFTTGTARRGRYAITFAGAPRCGGAAACTLGVLRARRGAPLGGRANLRLAGGVRGRYAAGRCGASCPVPSVAFVRRGVRYEVALKLSRPALVAAANAALRGGPR